MDDLSLKMFLSVGAGSYGRVVQLEVNICRMQPVKRLRLLLYIIFTFASHFKTNGKLNFSNEVSGLCTCSSQAQRSYIKSFFIKNSVVSVEIPTNNRCFKNRRIVSHIPYNLIVLIEGIALSLLITSLFITECGNF